MNAPIIDRSLFIGGSDAAAILGLSKWKTPLDLYREKRGEVVEDTSPERMKVLNRGKRWEPVVGRMLLDELKYRGHDVRVYRRNKRYKDPQHKFLACELDLELVLNGELVNCEIKTVHPFMAKDWGEEGTDEIPVYYTAQVMHGLMIKPRRLAIVAALIGVDDLRIHEVHRDEDIIQGMRDREVEFWHNNIQAGIPPAAINLDDVNSLFRRDNGLTIEASADLAENIELLRAEKQRLKEIEGIISHLEMQVLSLIHI